MVFGFSSRLRRADKRKLFKHVELLRSSPLLDPIWYRENYSDLSSKPLDVAVHYLTFGAAEGRNPGPNFNNLSADAPALDPFSTIRGGNPPHMIVNLRLNNGIGDGTVSRKISAFLNLSNNSKATAGDGGYAKAGIVIAADALDTSSGAGSAIQMGPNHAIDWYNSGSTPGWRILRQGNTGTGQIILGNNRFDLQLNSGHSQPLRVTTNGVGINVDASYAFDVVGAARYSYTTIAGGSAPTISGTCAATFVAGGNVAGKLNLTSSCTATLITLTFSQTTPNGYFCDATNENNVSAIVKQTADTTTSVTLTTTGATNDKILYKCVGF